MLWGAELTGARVNSDSQFQHGPAWWRRPESWSPLFNAAHLLSSSLQCLVCILLVWNSKLAPTPFLCLTDYLHVQRHTSSREAAERSQILGQNLIQADPSSAPSRVFSSPLWKLMNQASTICLFAIFQHCILTPPHTRMAH